MKFELDGKWVSADSPVYLIAEVGTTANGNVQTAKGLIQAAKDAGFDAIKFQNISPKDYMSDRTVKYRYMSATGPQEKNMFEMLEPLAFARDAWQEIMACARAAKITCFATVNWLGGVEWMEEVNAPAYKIASWDLNYPDLQRLMFQTGKPVFVDLGPVGIPDVLRIKEAARLVGNDKVVFLYDFHTNDPAEMHMRAIPYLQEQLGELVGFSSPGKHWELDILGLGLGAKVLEKRITLNDMDQGHHHLLALCGNEIPGWVKTIREMEKALGEKNLIPSQADLKDAEKYFRGVTTLRPVRKGEPFSPENLGAKRPRKGLAPENLELIWGKTASTDLDSDVQIDWKEAA